jgi:cytochrome c
MRILNGTYTPTLQEQARWDVAPLVDGVPQPDGHNTLGDYVVLQQKVLGAINF